MLESLLFTLGLGVVVTVGPEPDTEPESSEIKYKIHSSFIVTQNVLQRIAT